MASGKRQRKAQTVWAAIQEACLWSDQHQYEEIRPVVLFGQHIKERAAEIGVSRKPLSSKVQRFTQQGLPGFTQTALHPNDQRQLPLEMREAILQLKAEHAQLSTREIATICEVRFHRSLSHVTVHSILAWFALPSITKRRFLPYADTVEPDVGREAILRLHLEGWSVKAIASYLETSRRNVQRFLHRWWEEGVKGLPNSPRARKQLRKVTLGVSISKPEKGTIRR